MKIVKYATIVMCTASIACAMSLSEINKASKDELMQIKGIGESRAEAIMDARPFKNIAQLDDVKGIGPALLGNIKNNITKGSTSKRQKKKINLFEES